jgi:hypothetical protein
MAASCMFPEAPRVSFRFYLTGDSLVSVFLVFAQGFLPLNWQHYYLRVR